jgi:hypothetical protein
MGILPVVMGGTPMILVGGLPPIRKLWYPHRVQKSAPRFLYLILGLALALRVGLVLSRPPEKGFLDQLPDQREYLSLAFNLLHSGSLSFFDPRFQQTVYAYRMPGYPLFLALCGALVSFARLVQCVVDTSSVMAVYLIAVRLTGCTRVGRVAAFLLAVNPFYIFFSSLILSETVFAALILWGLNFLLRFPARSYAIGTLFLVAAAYVKTTGLLLVPTMAFAFALNNMPPSAYRLSNLRRWCLLYCVPITLLFSLEVLLFMLPWVWRNHNMLGQLVLTTTNGGMTLYDGFHSGATGASDQRFIAAMPQLMSINEVQRSAYLQRSAWDWAWSNATQLPALTAHKLLRGWSPITLSQDFGKPVYRLISAGYSVPFDVLCLLGVFSRRLRWQSKLLLLTPALVVTLGMALSVGSIRYRMPAEGPMAVIAATGLIGSKNSNDEIRMTKQ